MGCNFLEVHGICNHRLVHREVLRLDQTVRNLACGDVDILLVMIRLGVTILKKTKFVHLLDLLEGRGEKR